MSDEVNGALLASVLAAVMDSPADAVVAGMALCTPDDVAFLDRPSATCLEVALEMAKNGIEPTPVLLNCEMQRHGAYEGHHGELARARILEATATAAPGVRLPEYLAAVLADVVRTRMISAADAIADRARQGSESDAWNTFVREGATMRQLWNRLVELRGMTSMMT